MAIDNLNYYSAWLPAGQQTDRYSSQPWCLRSKNLDIFSSSKSVKATAWSEPTTTDADVVKQDGKLVLKTDWKVYERGQNWDTLVVDPSVNFPVFKVSYNWENWTYADAQWGTVQDMVVKYEWDEWKSFVVYTDRASYTYSNVKKSLDKTISYDDQVLQLQDTWMAGWYWNFHKIRPIANTTSVSVIIDNSPFMEVPIRIYADQALSTDSDISLSGARLYEYKYYYDWQMDAIVANAGVVWYTDLVITWDIKNQWWVEIIIPSAPTYSNRRILSFDLLFTKRDWATWYNRNGDLYIDMNLPKEDWVMHRADGTVSDWDSNEYYSYLPVRDRELVSVWDYGYSESFWMKGTSFQPLYKWTWTWVDVNWEKKVRYDFAADMWWESDVSMDVIWMIVWNEQVYMIWNLDWNWYIIPCDLTWWRWTPYIAYGCTFKWITNIDYLMYLVWDDRWISTLWVFNQQELVPVVWWREEKDSINLIKNEEQYKFDWKIVNRRKNLILTTEDNRVFQYWQTYGGKGGAFIHELPENATITWLKTNWNDLEINYSITESWITTNYTIKYQDDTPIKNYNLEWMAEYPIVIWNHLLEKEESDLFVSYILPSADCSLEFWGMANHYHFRTFTSEDDYTFNSELAYKLKWATWDYELKFIERNGNQYTFRLVWDLPIQTTNDMGITDTGWVELINYSEYNHFRKIWEITTTEYQEWEFRFHNLNNKLELPKSHSLQVMVKGKGNQNYTPELFALDLVANQRERW